MSVELCHYNFHKCIYVSKYIKYTSKIVTKMKLVKLEQKGKALKSALRIIERQLLVKCQQQQQVQTLVDPYDDGV